MAGTFYAGLGLVAIGSGLLKANISTMVGHLYDGPDDPRRDGGFTVFSMGINLGAFAALGMAFDLAQFLPGSRHLDARSSVVPTPLSVAEKSATLRKAAIWAGVAAVFYALVGFSGHYTLNWVMVPLILLGLVVPVVVLARIKCDKDLSASEQSSMSAYIWFFVAAAVFWMIYDQGATTLSIFADQNAENTVLGWEFPVSWYQSVNPVPIMAPAPVFAWFWLALNRRGNEPSTIVN